MLNPATKEIQMTGHEWSLDCKSGVWEAPGWGWWWRKQALVLFPCRGYRRRLGQRHFEDDVRGRWGCEPTWGTDQTEDRLQMLCRLPHEPADLGQSGARAAACFCLSEQRKVACCSLQPRVLGVGTVCTLLKEVWLDLRRTFNDPRLG